MEEFEVKALSTSPHPQVCGKVLWMTLLWSSSSTDEDIQFTNENTKVDGSMPFLDTMIIPQSEGNLTSTV